MPKDINNVRAHVFRISAGKTNIQGTKTANVFIWSEQVIKWIILMVNNLG
jgi:hypothetical protein